VGNKVVNAVKDVGRTAANVSGNLMTGGLLNDTGVAKKWGLDPTSMHTGFMQDIGNPLASGLANTAGHAGMALGLATLLGLPPGALGAGAGGLGGILGNVLGGQGQGGQQGGGGMTYNKYPQNVPEMMPVNWMTPPTGDTPLARGYNTGEGDLQQMMQEARTKYLGGQYG
jgi:hypothetical protein